MSEIVFRNFGCQRWADIYKIVVENVCNRFSISDQFIILHEFSMNLQIFLSTDGLFDNCSHFSKVNVVSNTFRLIVHFFLVLQNGRKFVLYPLYFVML